MPESRKNKVLEMLALRNSTKTMPGKMVRKVTYRDRLYRTSAGRGDAHGAAFAGLGTALRVGR